MIIVHGTFPVKLEVRGDALELLRQMANASREEEGCISYEFYVGLTDPNTLLLFQEWESVDALQGHFETDHMEEFLKFLKVHSSSRGVRKLLPPVSVFLRQVYVQEIGEYHFKFCRFK